MTIRKAYVDTPAGQIHYRHQAGNGAPVIFLHRTPVWSSSFERVFAELEGWRPLYAFDTPGFGESFTPTEPSTALDYRDWFIAALDALAIEEFHLVGHHTGSHFAIEIAAHLPARVRSLVIDGAMYITNEERAERRATRSPAPPIDKAGVYVRQGWEFLVAFYPTFVAETVHQEFVGAMRSLQTREVCINALMDQDYGGVLSRVDCPIHACTSQDDVYVGLLPKIAADFPKATVSTYGPAGIAGPELQAPAFAAIVRDMVETADRQ